MSDAGHKQSSHSAAGHSTSDSPHRERRAFPRYPFVADAELTDVNSAARLPARTTEVSLCGCYLELLNPLSPGTPIRLRLLTDEAIFETPGRVVYSHPGIGMGVAFLDTELEQRKVLWKWVSELRNYFKDM
jgi:hypothetical protein